MALFRVEKTLAFICYRYEHDGRVWLVPVSESYVNGNHIPARGDPLNLIDPVSGYHIFNRSFKTVIHR